jgi:hypothetical protein
MINKLRTLWRPETYHGSGAKGQFFEGWYYKLVNADQSQRWAIIPGVFLNQNPAKSHAFIQVLDGISNQATYHRFPLDHFRASTSTLDIQIGPNQFSSHGLQIDLPGEDRSIHGSLQLAPLIPWPVRWHSPGVMGWYAFVPFMQTYHGVLSFDHRLKGALDIAGKSIDFTDGRGYIEKDWGRTFPRAYIWMQSNHFEEEASLSASIATIPWLGSWFRGFLAGFWFDGQLFRFTTYTGGSTEELTLSEHEVNWSLSGDKRVNPALGFKKYHLTLCASRNQGGIIAAPEISGMEPRIVESLTAEIEVRLTALEPGGREVVLFEGTGASAGLEVAGSVEEIADQSV